MMHFSSDPEVAEQQMHAIIYYLTAFGYVDGDFDKAEKSFIRDYIGRLVAHRADEAMGDDDASLKAEVVGKWTAHFHEVLDSIEAEIAENMAEPVAEGEESVGFVVARLKLRCFELFKQFPEDSRVALLSTVDELMLADGTTHPSEVSFRSELAALLDAPMEIAEIEIETLEEGAVVIADAVKVAPKAADHPFFSRSEWDYAKDKETFAKQSAADVDVVRRVIDRLEERRRPHAGKLKLGTTFHDFADDKPFADGHVVVHPPRGKDHELLVLGDLHGCYSCLKAALLQADFFAKVQAYHDDPDSNPNILLVLLGDYIDRGRYSYSGILRTVLQLYLTVPDHVVPLRGNHEYYVELNGRVYGAVKPSEAMTSLQDIASNEVFGAYMKLFEALPHSFCFDKLFFVHAGIPRDDTMAEKWTGLESLNDFDIRFQMLWSDPSQADAVPVELQKQSARFPFGKRQFRNFMHKIGCTTMIRGHERVVDGFREIYSEPDARLLNLFSAGGRNNQDLPPDSNYREVRPMALTIKHTAGINEVIPFEIEYDRYNSPDTNAFFKQSLAASQ